MNSLEEIYNELQNNPQFHRAFKENPERALQEAGFELTPQDLEKIKAMLKFKNSEDGELDDRINK